MKGSKTFCLLVMLIGGSVYSRDVLVDAAKLFPEDNAKAVKLLKKNIKSRDKTLAIKCKIRLAEYYDSQKEFGDSIKLLKKFEKFTTLKKQKVPYRQALEAYSEFSFASGASGGIYKGLKALNIVNDRTHNLENVLVSYYYAKLLHFYAKDQEAKNILKKDMVLLQNT